MWPRARGAATVGWVAQVEKRGRKVEKEQGQARELEWGLRAGLEWGPRAGERLDQRQRPDRR